MDSALDALSNITDQRNRFALCSDKTLLKSIDDALSSIYKEGFSSASVLKQRKSDQTVKPKRKGFKDQWLLPALLLENMATEQLWQQLELWNRKALPLSIEMSSWTLLKDNRDSESEESSEISTETESELEDGEKVDFTVQDKFEVASSSEGEDFEEVEGQHESFDEGAEDESHETDIDDEAKESSEKHVRFADDNNDEEDDVEDEEDTGDENVEENGKEESSKDKFFDMAEFEKFADEEIDAEGDEMLYSDFLADPKDTGDDKATYADFFGENDGPVNKKARKAIDDRVPKSSFEKRLAMEKNVIGKIEEENLAPKPWMLSGEVDARERPQNSLLEHHVEFEHATRLAPIVTEDFSKSIEDLVKQRIIDKAWDDVERKVKPVADVNEFRRRAMLDSEKSKMSLAELYEKDYVDKQLDPTGREIPADEKVEAIKSKMRELFLQLDSLSHFQFTPKAPAPELRIVKNVASATLEEAAPVTVSDAALLAPAEVKRPISGELKSKEEQSETDRKRARRRAKAHQRAQQKTKMEKLVQRAANGDTKASKLLALEKLKTGSRVKIAGEEEKKTKKGAKKTAGSKSGKAPVVSGVKSSSEFFARLQDEVDTQIRQRGGKTKKRQNTAAQE